MAWCRLYDDGELFEIDSVGVLPDRRGVGLGHAVVEGTLSAASQRDVFLVADARPRRLYERLGFVAVGQRTSLSRAPS